MKYEKGNPQMVDMKMTAAEKKNQYPMEVSSKSDEQYPYGICIRLENAELEKLNMKSLPKPGEHFFIQAIAKVKSSHISEEEDDYQDRAVSLQITDLSLTKKYGAV